MEISARQGRQNKIHILVDGEYIWTIDAEYWFSCPYCRITRIEEGEQAEKFKEDIGSRCAYIAGLRSLSYGDSSRKNLRDKLITKGHRREYVEIALDRLEDYGFINDLRFARNLRDKLSSSKHMSKAGIKQELYRKGVDRETIDTVLAEFEIDPGEEIEALLSGKYSKYLGDEKGRKKTAAALQRLGYGWSDIKSALEKYDRGIEEEYYD